MMLSERAIEALVAATTPGRIITAAEARPAARKAVAAAAKELGLDEARPPFPDFKAGEGLIPAACRVLKLPVEKPLAQHRARAEAARVAAARIAELKQRRADLRRAEHDRLRDAILAEKAPGASPAKPVAELQALQAELDLIGSVDVETFVPTIEVVILRDAVTAADVLPSAAFYGQLIVAALVSMNEGERTSPKGYRTLQQAAAELQGLSRRLEFLPDEGSLELLATVRRVQRCVELADLHASGEQPDSWELELEAWRARDRAAAGAP